MSELAILGTYSVFLASYVVFALGKFPGMKIDRPGAAIIGAVLMFMTGAVRVENSPRLIHFGTIVLLFSMMLVVAYLHLAGFFDWVTELVVTRLKPHPSAFSSGGSSFRRHSEIPVSGNAGSGPFSEDRHSLAAAHGPFHRSH